MPKQCTEKNRHGKRCGAWAVKGGTKCHLHSDPEKASKLGQRGGRRRAMLPPMEPGSVQPPENATDVKNILAKSMTDVLTGQLDPRLANTAGYLGTAVLKAVEVSDVQEELAEVKAMLKAILEADRGPQKSA